MRSSRYILGWLAVFLIQACNQTGLYNQKTKTLDSLNGALNLKLRELAGTDTVLLQRCILRYNYYRQFIKQNISDTLAKNEADHLRRFCESGKNLENFHSNRFTIIGRAGLMNAQQIKLAADLKSKAMGPGEAEPYINREREATAQLIEAADAQQKLYYTSLEEFKNALREVENLIRARNNGQLPTIVKDTLAL